jgi:hypothetical protein
MPDEWGNPLPEDEQYGPPTPPRFDYGGGWLRPKQPSAPAPAPQQYAPPTPPEPGPSSWTDPRNEPIYGEGAGGGGSSFGGNEPQPHWNAPEFQRASNPWDQEQGGFNPLDQRMSRLSAEDLRDNTARAAVGLNEMLSRAPDVEPSQAQKEQWLDEAYRDMSWRLPGVGPSKTQYQNAFDFERAPNHALPEVRESLLAQAKRMYGLNSGLTERVPIRENSDTGKWGGYFNPVDQAIYTPKNANPSTLAHEFAHAYTLPLNLDLLPTELPFFFNFNGELTNTLQKYPDDSFERLRWILKEVKPEYNSYMWTVEPFAYTAELYASNPNEVPRELWPQFQGLYDLSQWPAQPMFKLRGTPVPPPEIVRPNVDTSAPPQSNRMPFSMPTPEPIARALPTAPPMPQITPAAPTTQGALSPIASGALPAPVYARPPIETPVPTPAPPPDPNELLAEAIRRRQMQPLKSILPAARPERPPKRTGSNFYPWWYKG